jgi:hypothetical protein
MNKKLIVSIFITISSLAFIACASSVTSTAVANNDTNSTMPAKTIAPEIINADAPIIETNMDPNLACSGGKTSATVTVELTEGPYYTPNTPERSTLYETGMPGTKLVLMGYVYDINCQPVANAWLDFWQADANGNYDNNDYTLRGHQFTDENGRYELITVVPGIYPGRTEHIHFKVQAPNGKAITSQLFFPGVSQNESDGIYDDSLLLSIQEASDGLLGQYNFIVPAQ